MKCEYCGVTSEVEGQSRCNKCGAEYPKKPEEYKVGPLFYEGYICYYIKDLSMDTLEVQFWQGRELLERIILPRDLINERVPDGCDFMEFFFDLFKLAHGEKDVVEWQQKNNKYPATFIVTRRENPEKERWISLSMRDLADLYRR